MAVMYSYLCVSVLLYILRRCDGIVKRNAEAEAAPVPLSTANLMLLSRLGLLPGGGSALGNRGLAGVLSTAGISNLGSGGVQALLSNPSLLPSGPLPTLPPGFKPECDNQDFLTNLLVYQYLSNSLGGGEGQTPPPKFAKSLVSPKPVELSTTITTISTSFTVQEVQGNPTTRFSTATSSYTTTVTSIDKTVIPVIFRGSKVIKTLTESSTKVITATEYFTSSSVLHPTILKTLPVHITITETSTRGPNGKFTIADFVTGSTSVLAKPVATRTLDLEAEGLSKGDLSGINIKGLSNNIGKDPEMLLALTSLLKQYTGDSKDEAKSSPSKTRQNKGLFGSENENLLRNRPFQGDSEAPKFNIIKGFTLEDPPAGRGKTPSEGPREKGGTGGTASTDTRYSKFLKNRLENNNLAVEQEQDRERERFSASTSRKTFSRAENPRPVNRFRWSPHRNRESNSRPGRQTFQPNRVSRYHSRVRRRSVTTIGSAFNAIPNRTPVAIEDDGSKTFNVDPSNVLSVYPATRPALHQDPASGNIIRLLKQLEKERVKEMLSSIQKWVDYYSQEVLKDSSLSLDNDIHLSPSLSSLESSQIGATGALPSSSKLWILQTPSLNTEELCPEQITVTETIHHTIYLAKL